jgi:hypothetical protein
MTEAIPTNNQLEKNAEDELIAQIGKLLAKEYIFLMKQKKGSTDEGSDLCSLLE